MLIISFIFLPFYPTLYLSKLAIFLRRIGGIFFLLLYTIFATVIIIAYIFVEDFYFRTWKQSISLLHMTSRMPWNASPKCSCITYSTSHLIMVLLRIQYLRETDGKWELMSNDDRHDCPRQFHHERVGHSLSSPNTLLIKDPAKHIHKHIYTNITNTD